jgi:hypothetical protein
VCSLVSIACSALPTIGTAPTPTPIATESRPADVDATPRFTDPPLPTFDDKTPGPIATDGPWELPECLDSYQEVDVYPEVETLVGMSSVIAIATFEEYGEPGWSTLTGERPTTEEYVHADYPVSIVREISLDVDDYLRGTDTDLAGAFVRGGELGCDKMEYSHMPELEEGAEAVFFVGPLLVHGLGSQQVPQLLRVWWIYEGGFQPYYGPGSGMTQEELEEMIQQVPFEPWDPVSSPSPSSSSAPTPSGS